LLVGSTFLVGEVEVAMLRDALEDPSEAGAADTLLARKRDFDSGIGQDRNDCPVLRDLKFLATLC